LATVCRSPRQVDADAIAEDMIERLILRNAGAALRDCDHEFHLVMQRLSERRVRHVLAVMDDAVGWLLEEEGRIAFVRAFIHLAHMGEIIASDAIHAADGKTGGCACDWQRCNVWPGDDERAHGCTFFWSLYHL
jgi:hypothetical protein